MRNILGQPLGKQSKQRTALPSDNLIPESPSGSYADNHIPESPSGSYADILYPSEILKVMVEVLCPSQEILVSDLNITPETYIDKLLKSWLGNVHDQTIYARDLLAALKVRNCVDCFFARINLDCLILTTGNTVRITQTPRWHPNWPGNHIRLGEQLRLPADSKQMFKRWLITAGYQWTDNLLEAQSRLEDQLRNKDLEQLILARIGFLILCQQSRGIMDYLTEQTRLHSDPKIKYEIKVIE